MEKNKTKFNSKKVCGVPQCRSHANDVISLHKIPKSVMENEKRKKLWSTSLEMELEFPKQFLICNLHFKKDCFLNFNTKKRFLKFDSLPTKSTIQQESSNEPIQKNTQM